MKSKKVVSLVSIIYVYYNTPKEIVNSLQSIIRGAAGIKYEIIIIDNNSPQPLPTTVSSFTVKILKNKNNVGFGAAINQAERLAKGNILLFINPDTVFFPRSISLLASRLLENKGAGVIGPKILSKDGKILDSISSYPFIPKALVIFSFLKKIWPFSLVEKRYHLRSFDRDKEHEVSVVSGACMCLRREVFEKAGGFDKRFFMYFEEADLCRRVEGLGFKNIYFPKAKLTHLVGRSSDDKVRIKKIFEKSRYIFLKKYHGKAVAIISEGFFRFFTLDNLLMIFLLFVSGFLMFYRLSTLMMFFGDFGRDFLSARDAVTHGTIPLVGITSSVTWLHQGPVSVWLIAASFLLGNFNPLAPGYFYAFIGVLTTILIYKAGEMMFNKQSGFFAALFFATSPLILVNIRIPYHTSPIPFFTMFFLFFLWKFLRQGSHIFILGITLGILLLFELSNAVLFFVIAVVYLIYRPKISKSKVILWFLGLVAGLTPFILYDITHRFAQTIGFALWVVNRIRLFFGLTLSGASTTVSASSAFGVIFAQMRRIINPQDSVIVIVVLLVILYVFIFERARNTKIASQGLSICFIWVVVSIVGFAVHAAPGTAYFPIIFAPIAILIGYSFCVLGKKWNPFYLFFAILVTFNAIYTLNNQYFIDTYSFSGSLAKGWGYGLGEGLIERQKVADFILHDSDGRLLQIRGGGFLRMFASSVDNYKYLVWFGGGRESENPEITYTIFQRREDVPKGKKIVYTNSFAYVTKD